jgi:hypothetical protein
VIAASPGVEMYHEVPDDLLRRNAREAIDSGKLPAERQIRTFGESGSGQTCAVCNQPVMWHMTELELEFDYNVDNTHGTESFKMHHRCFAAWEFERRQISGTSS